MVSPTTAASLFSAVGLLPDGPVPWGRPVGSRTAGVLILELAAPRTTAPIELTRVGKWLERVPDLRMDGARPSSRGLAARLGTFWLPGQTVLYIGSTTGSLGGRATAIETTSLGDRRPHAAGYWLKTLNVLPTARWWWAATDAPEEYEDALIEAFAAAVPDADRGGLPDGSSAWPFAVLRRPTGERRPSGITGALAPEPVATPTPPTRITVLPDGDADGADREPAERKRPAARAGARPVGGGARALGATRRSGTAATTNDPRTESDAVSLTAEGAARLRDELRVLTEERRPEVIARIRTAKEFGDLKENADYTAAREEQSFLEGRIQALEARLRHAVVVDAPAAGTAADLGSRVTVEIDGVEEVYVLVGSAEADVAAGRVSVASPIGRALVGAHPDGVVEMTTPRGPVEIRVLAVE